MAAADVAGYTLALWKWCMNTIVRGVILNDVRRFAGYHKIELSRINLLVGANSIAKSSFMGCINALGQLANLERLNDVDNPFDQFPFSMGEFDTIVRSKCDSFQVGLDFDNELISRFVVEFERNKGGSLKEKKLELQFPNRVDSSIDELQILRENVNGQELWVFHGPRFAFPVGRNHTSYEQFTTWISRSVRHGNLPFSGEQSFYRKDIQTTNEENGNFVKFANFFRQKVALIDLQLNIKAIEPNSLKPQRRYEQKPLPEIDDSDHLERLRHLGQKLGIFQDIMQKKVEDGFEIYIELDEESHNLCDVGYGVASMLPFLGTMAATEAESLFLLQQPEVHIHPESQAELVKIMARSVHSFIIETHSDHFIDWFRIMVKENEIPHSDLTIIYFEEDPDNPSATCIYPITLDKVGNLVGNHDSYRAFFTDESWRLLGYARED